MSRNAVIVFVKNPKPGKVKTRLEVDLGKEKTLIVYKKLITLTLKATALTHAETFVYFSDEIPQDVGLPYGVMCRTQNGNNLGQRMETAFDEILADYFDKIVIIGSDCPSLSAGHLNKAFSMLDVADIVLGPAADGGYYLLGMKKMVESVFQNKNWSTDTVLQDTLQDIRNLNLNYSLLETLSDLDTITEYEQQKHLLDDVAPFSA